MGGWKKALNLQLEGLGVSAFGEIEVVPEFVSGAVAVAQANGIAGIESNTVMFGWTDKPERCADQLRIIEELSTLGIGAVICRSKSLDAGAAKKRTIDVWWGGLQANGDMLALFAHLLSLNPEWRDSSITIKSIATSEMMLERNRQLLDRMISSARLSANVEVMLHSPDQAVIDTISEESANADAVLLGLRPVKAGEELEYAARLAEFIDRLPSVLFVRSAGEFRGRLLGQDLEPSHEEAPNGK